MCYMHFLRAPTRATARTHRHMMRPHAPASNTNTDRHTHTHARKHPHRHSIHAHRHAYTPTRTDSEHSFVSAAVFSSSKIAQPRPALPPRDVDAIARIREPPFQKVSIESIRLDSLDIVSQRTLDPTPCFSIDQIQSSITSGSDTILQR